MVVPWCHSSDLIRIIYYIAGTTMYQMVDGIKIHSYKSVCMTESYRYMYDRKRGKDICEVNAV